MTRFRCSQASRASGEPLYATASHVRRWVLLEERGPWGRDALLESRLPVDLGAALRRHAGAAKARVLLIRRHGRYQPAGRTVFVAVTTPSLQRLERLHLQDPAELLDLDWQRLRRDEPVGGEPHDEPVYLVCTNGSHDACCAEFGRPLAAALAALAGDQVWECSHFGGDRFAANLVCLPAGVYYGRVDPADAPRVVADHVAGRVHLDHYRGRCSQPFPVQAAEFFVRRERGLLGLDDLAVEHRDDPEPGCLRVRFRLADGRRVLATVAVDADADAQQLTCRSDTLACPPRYRLVRLEEE